MPNTAPVAVADSYSTHHGTTLTVNAAAGLLVNDTDADSDPITVPLTSVTTPAHGSVAVNSDGAFTYTPISGYVGSDSFSYQANDGTVDSASATVTINVTNTAPSASGNSYTVTASPLNVSAPGVLGNDSDADGDTLTAELVSNVSAGSLTLNLDGSFSYIPGMYFTGSDSFTYKAKDGAAYSSTVTVSLTNNAPTANGDSLSTHEDTPKTITLSGSDVETVELSFAIVSGPSNGSLGTISLNTGAAGNPNTDSATVIYTPNLNYFGTDSFTYKVGDGVMSSSTVTVNITVNPVNDVPLFAKGIDEMVQEDAGPQSVNPWASGLSAGPFNESSQALNFIVGNNNNALFSTQPAISNTGTLTYTPAANVFGTATVTVQIHDNGGTNNGGVDTSAAQSFTITVYSVNDVPVADGGSFGTNEDTPKTIPLSGSDVETVELTFSIVSGPANGTLSSISDNSGTSGTSGAPNTDSASVVYTPAADFYGTDSFTYQVYDGTDYSSTVTVTITVASVNDAPRFTKGVDQPVNEDAGAQNVFGWATSISPGALNELSQVLDFIAENDNNALFSAPPAVSPFGTLTYTPAADAHGTATVTVRLHDDGGTADGGQDTSAAQTFTITVNPVNDVPSFTKGGNQTANEDAAAQSVSGWATNISVGPSNESSQTPNFIVGNNNNALFSAQPAISASGTLTYTPAANANGTATVTVQIHDNGGTANGGVNTSDEQTFTITINAINDAPQGDNRTRTTHEDTALPLTADAFGFSDPIDAPWSGGANALAAVVITTLPTAGTLTLSGTAVTAMQSVSVSLINAGMLVFTPVANANGTGYASFTFQVQDDGGTSNGGSDLDLSPNTLIIDVTPVNDAPSFTKGGNQTVAEDSPTQSVSGWATYALAYPASPTPLATDEAGQVLNFVVTNNYNAHFLAQPAVAPDGTLTYTPAPNATGTATVSVYLHDNGGTDHGGSDNSATQTFTITVTPVNDAPAGTDKAVTTLEDTAHTFSAADFGFTDPQDAGSPNALFAVKITTLPGNGSLTRSGVPVSAGDFVSKVDIDGGLLRFAPAANANGTNYTSFTFQVQDDGGTSNGGGDLDAFANTLTIHVTSVNDAPQGSDKTVGTNEDTDYTFSAADFGFSDSVDAGSTAGANVLLAVKIVSLSLPISSSLKLDGVAVTNGQFVSHSDLAANKLKFSPAANANGTSYASFTFQVQDDGGTVNSGVNLDPTARTMTIDVAPVNDAPEAEDDPNGVSYAWWDFDENHGSTATDLIREFSGTLPVGVTWSDDVPGFPVTGSSLRFASAAGPLAVAGFSLGDKDFTAALSLKWTTVGDATLLSQGGWQLEMSGGHLRFVVATPTGALTLLDHPWSPNAGQWYRLVVTHGGDVWNLYVDGIPVANTTNAVTFPGVAPGLAIGSAAFAGHIDEVVFDRRVSGGMPVPPYPFAEDLPGNLLVSELLANDDDVDGDPLTLLAHTTVGHGTLVLHDNNTPSDLLDDYFIYTPSPNYNGPDRFTYTVDDGMGATDTATVYLRVLPVNDAPQGANNSVTTAEDTAYTFAVDDFSFSDPVDAPQRGGPNRLLSVTITTLPAAGTLTNDNVAVTAGAVIAKADIAAGKLKFTPAANGNGTNYANFAFQVQDDGGTSNGGNDFDASPNTMTIHVTPVNDAPQGSDNTVPTLEDTDLVFAAAHFGFSDPVDGGAHTLLAVKLGSLTLPAGSSLKLDGVNVTSGQSVSKSDLDAGKLRFSPAANANGAGYANFTFQVQDNGGSNPGDDLDPAPNTLTIDVTAVNDAPSFTKGTNQTVAEDSGAQTVSGWAANLSPGPGDESGQALDFLVTNNNNALFSVQPAIAPNGTLSYTPAADANGSVTVTVRLHDIGGTANSGADTSAAQTFTITLTPVNDAPQGSDTTVEAIEDTAYPFSAADFGFSDPVDAAWASGANALLAVKLTTLPSAGVLKKDNVPVNAGDFVAKADLDAGKLTFTPAVNAHGANYASFTFQVQDDGGTSGGGSDLDASANTLTIDASSVNDAPQGADNSVTTLEDNDYTFTTAVFGFSDPNDSPADALHAVKISALPSAGTLKLNGVAVSVGQTVSVSDLNAGKLKFTPAANANGTNYASFTFQVQDDGGTSNSGSNLDPSPNTLTVNVTAVNDAPSFTKGADQTVLEDANAQSITGWATNLSSGPGDESSQALAFLVTNDNNALFSAQPALSATGTLTFTPAANANGTATVTVRLHDNGGTANGGVDTSAAQTFTITVNPVNDAPNFTKGGNQTVSEDADTQSVSNWATGISAGPSNESSQALNFIVSNDNNALFSTQPAISATGTLTYTLAPDAYGVAVVTVQIHDDGGTSDSGKDTSATQTFTITVDPVNDVPSFTKGGNQTVDEDASPQTVSNWATYLLTGPSNESSQTLGFLVSNDNVSLFEVQPAVSASGTLTYTPAENASGTATVTVQIHDDGGTDNGGVDTSATQTFTITLTPINDAPIVDDAFFGVLVNTTCSVAVPGLLAYAYDFDGDALLVEVKPVQAPEHGTLVLTSNGAFTYTPDTDYTGPDSFLYSVSDGTTATTGLVTLNVHDENAAPTAEDAFYAMRADGTLSILDRDGLLLAAWDDDGDPLTAVLDTNPSQGQLIFRTGGGFDYTPPLGYLDTVTFTYHVTDGTDSSNVATVTIDVSNATPVTEDSSFEVHANQSLTAGGLLDKAFDADNDLLSAQLVTSPSVGTLSFQSDGSFTYQPPGGFIGDVSFTYLVSDGSLTSSPATVTISVTDTAPVLGDSHYRLLSGTTLQGTGLLASANDDDGDTLTALLVTPPAHASVFALNPDGTFTYTPVLGYIGTDSFTIQATDSALTSAAAQVTLEVVTGPVAIDDGYSLDGENSIVVAAEDGVLANDFVPAGMSGIAELLDGPRGVTDPGGTTRGTLTLNADGSFVYVKDPTYANDVFFNYVLPWGNGLQVWATVTLQMALMELKIQTISFLGSNVIFSDPDQNSPLGIARKAQHWHDLNRDGVIQPNTQEHQFPVSYSVYEKLPTQNAQPQPTAKMEMSLRFAAGTQAGLKILTFNKISIRGKLSANGKDLGLAIPPTDAVFGTGTGKYEVARAMVDKTFAETIKTVEYYPSLKIEWEYSLDQGTTWRSAGASENPFALTLYKPTNATTFFHSVVYWGSNAARGSTTMADVITKTWKVFASKDITTLGGKVLKYYGNWNSQARLLAPLLSTGDGQCTAWSYLLAATFRAQGLPPTALKLVHVLPSTDGGQSATTDKQRYFLVKPWNFPPGAKPNNVYKNVPDPAFSGLTTGPLLVGLPAWRKNPTTGEFEYMWKGVPQVTYAAGAATVGQNNKNPTGAFNNHEILKVTYPDAAGQDVVIFFDASYGTSFTDLTRYENSAIAGYYDTRRTNRIDFKQREFLIRINDETKVELKFVEANVS